MHLIQWVKILRQRRESIDLTFTNVKLNRCINTTNLHAILSDYQNITYFIIYRVYFKEIMVIYRLFLEIYVFYNFCGLLPKRIYFQILHGKFDIICNILPQNM
ncbi:hypothetical protein H311_00868 [Anncaliia algerae PRA109]|nr:hypothetical protein H311_00868 [Anncaliia algerae PRA109]